MSRNGSGTYNLPAGNPVVSGTTITSSWANTTMQNIADALTQSIAADGQTPMSGALNMVNNKITSLGDPTNAQDAATKAYVDTADSLSLLKANNLSDVANATTARGNLTAAKSGANSDITSLTGLTTALSVAQGGTGVTTSTGSGAVVLGTSPTISSPTISSPTINGTPVMNASVITRATAVAAVGGTSIDFTSIPSWVKRITVMFSDVSLDGSSSYLVQLGDSGGIETTGYTSTSVTIDSTGGSTGISSTSGLAYFGGSASYFQNGLLVIANLTGNLWTSNHAGNLNTTNIVSGGGTKTLSATLDRIRITTVNGTDVFDGGSINILYE